VGWFTKKEEPWLFFLEVLLWITFILPGIAYSLWRLTNKITVCPACSNENLLPMNTPKGQIMYQDIYSR